LYTTNLKFEKRCNQNYYKIFVSNYKPLAAKDKGQTTFRQRYITANEVADVTYIWKDKL